MAQSIDSGLTPVLLALAKYESVYDPGAIGDGGTSFGLLQMHQGGGLGDGHSQTDLLNPEYNLRLGAQYIRGRLANGASLYDALSPWSVRDLAWADLQAQGYTGPGNGGGGNDPMRIAGGLGLVALVLAILILTD